MKKIFLLSVFLSISAQTAENNSATKELLWFFPPGIIQTTDPVKQWQELSRYMQASWDAFQGNWDKNQLLIPDPDSLVIETDIESTASVINFENPTKMKLVLDHYVRMPDGRIRVTTLNEQRYITEQEKDVVVNYLLDQTKKARDRNFAYYQQLEETAVRIRSAKLGILLEEFRKSLDVPIKGYKYPITVRDLNYLPQPMKPSGFVPRELHLGYNPNYTGILGMAWLNTGLVYYNPCAVIRDYLEDHPGVLQHEMVHTNSNLQSWPAANGFDAEQMASIPEMLYPENQLDFFFHGYAGTMRELSWIYSGFNFNQARDEIVIYNLSGTLKIDEEKMRSYFQKLELVKKEWLNFFQTKGIPEYFSDPLHWATLHNKLQGWNDIFYIVMAINYNPTILGGEKETLTWLEANETKIKEIADRAYELSGKPLDPNEKDEGFSNSPKSLVDFYSYRLTQEEKQKIRSYFENHPEVVNEFSKMNLKEIINFLRGVLAQ